MKKALLAAVVSIIILASFSALTIENAQAEHSYSYGMQIFDMENDYLPQPAVPFSTFQKGLKLQVTNYTEQSDRFMILCVLNGVALRFTTHDDANAKQAFYEIGAYEGLEIPITVHIQNLSSDDNILHIILVGLLDWMPKDNYDFFHSYSTTVSIPISSEGYIDEYADIVYLGQNQNITPEVAPNLREITLISENGMLDDSIQVQYQASTDGFLLDSAVYNKIGRMCALFLVDNQLIQIDGRDSIILQGDPSSVYRFQQDIALSEGMHQIYAIWLPLDQHQPAFFSTTDKITVHVMN